jgi:hypothetical protein
MFWIGSKSIKLSTHSHLKTNIVPHFKLRCAVLCDTTNIGRSRQNGGCVGNFFFEYLLIMKIGNVGLVGLWVCISRCKERTLYHKILRLCEGPMLPPWTSIQSFFQRRWLGERSPTMGDHFYLQVYGTLAHTILFILFFFV